MYIHKFFSFIVLLSLLIGPTFKPAITSQQPEMLSASKVFTDIFTYIASIINSTTNDVNSAPIANDDFGTGFITNEDTTIVLEDILTNDSDPDGDPLFIDSFDAGTTTGLLTFLPASGGLDTSFDDDGKTSIDFSNSFDYGHAIVTQPDGKIIIAGSTHRYNNEGYNFALVRYNSDGSLDTNFGSDGTVITDIDNSTSDYARAMVLQPDGKIIVAGYIDANIVHIPYFGLARYNHDGSLDTSFDGDGKVTTAFTSRFDYAYALALQPDGKIIVAGHTKYSSEDFALARYNIDGSLDTSFDDDGMLTTDLGGADLGKDIALQPDGKIVVAGSSDGDFALVRYTPNGDLDTSFDNDGMLTTHFGIGDDFGRDVVLQPDGKIVVAGIADNGSTHDDFALARYNHDGSLDTSFDSDGMFTIDVLDSSDGCQALVLQPDNKILAAGTSYNGNNFDFSVARYDSGSSGNFNYDPNSQFEWLTAGEVFTDTFTYVVSDGILTDTAIVNIAVHGINDVPITNNDFGPGFTTDEDTLIRLNDVLANDRDPEGVRLMIEHFDTTHTFGLVTYTSGQDSALDTSFNGDGMIITSFADAHFYDLALQPDGKIVGAGTAGSNDDFSLVRYNTDGSLDTSFDEDGIITTDIAGGTDSAYGLAIQPNGRILVGGRSQNGDNFDFAVIRYNPNGSLDTSFDGDGIVTTTFGTETAFARALALQPDGKIILAGGSVSSFALARYNVDGSLDTSFNGNGMVTTDFAGNNDIGYALALQPDGKIIVAGTVSNNHNDFALARYNTDGSLDTSFDEDGKLITDLAGYPDHCRALALQPDGKIVAAGYTDNGSYIWDFALVRYNQDGSLDASFDGDGILTTNFAGLNDEGYALGIQPDGKIILAGKSHHNFALARYNPDGSLDVNFDEDGLLTTDFASNWETGYALTLQPDGKIIVAGNAWYNYYDFALARYGNSYYFNYDPNSQFEWLAAGDIFTDTINYVSTDGFFMNNAVISITIHGVNDAPVADDQVITINENTTYVGELSTSDVDSNSLSHSLESLPTHGALAVALDGTFTYTPTLDYSGTDVFTFTVSDGTLSDVGCVELIINPGGFLGPLSDSEFQYLLESKPLHWDFGNNHTITGILTSTTDEYLDTGTYIFNLEVTGPVTPTDSHIENGTYTFTLTVSDALNGIGQDWLIVADDNVFLVLKLLSNIELASSSPPEPQPSSDFTYTITITLTWGDGLIDTLNLAIAVDDSPPFPAIILP